MNTGKNKDGWVKVVIPNGMYDEEGLNYFLSRYFNSFLDQYPNSISSNLSKMKFVIIFKGYYRFRFNCDICVILVFENEAELSSKYNEGTKVANIARNIDDIHIHCSLVDSSIVNGNARSDVI